ncbi:Integral membrane protein TerC family protein [Bacillus sp. THAF10]|nr:Integral membrane protein TerC family protein [Bacillus sp. THAF10]
MITSILIIIGIDIVLGGDNAIVIALACRNLPEHQRNKAILAGTFLAIITRILLTIGAVFLLSIPFVTFIGGILLLYIAFQLIGDHKDSTVVKGSTTLMTAIKTIVIADIIMGTDNVMAVAGASHGNLTLVAIGLAFSIPIIIWGSKIILFAMEKYPVIIYLGASILCYTAGKMITAEPTIAFLLPDQVWQMFLPYLLICIIVGTAFFKRKVKIK